MKNNLPLSDLIKFSELLNQFRLVNRKVLVNGENRYENDVEHSYQLTMLAWYIVSSSPINLDLTKVLRYALAHDLVEVYAGDTFAFTDNKELRDSKEQREHEAAERIKKEFPEFQELHQMIEGYEKRKDKESKFVYALDKLQPTIQIYADNGRSWQEASLSLERIFEKGEKMAISPEVKEWFDELCELLSRKEQELFPKKKI